MSGSGCRFRSHKRFVYAYPLKGKAGRIFPTGPTWRKRWLRAILTSCSRHGDCDHQSQDHDQTGIRGPSIAVVRTPSAEVACDGYDLEGLLYPTTETNEKTANDMKKPARTEDESPSRLIDARIKELDDWRGKTLAHVRALIRQADPEMVEGWKWRGVPVWYHNGIICTGETYKSVVKLTFAKGASLQDPSGPFNASLEGNTRRAIDLHEDDEVDADAFKTLIGAAVALNR